MAFHQLAVYKNSLFLNLVSLIVMQPSYRSLLFLPSWKRVGWKDATEFFLLFWTDRGTQISFAPLSHNFLEQVKHRAATCCFQRNSKINKGRKLNYSDTCPYLHLRKHYYIVRGSANGSGRQTETVTRAITATSSPILELASAITKKPTYSKGQAALYMDNINPTF